MKHRNLDDWTPEEKAISELWNRAFWYGYEVGMRHANSWPDSYGKWNKRMANAIIAKRNHVAKTFGIKLPTCSILGWRAGPRYDWSRDK